MKRILGSVIVGLALVLALLIGLAVAAINQPAAYAAPMLTENGVRDTITPTAIAVTGTAQSLGNASGDGQKFANTGDDFILVANAYTATITLTVVTGGEVGSIPISDVDVAIAAGATELVGPFNKSIFDQPSGTDAGKIYLNWNTAVTGTVDASVTLAVYRLQ
jgi:hypothetical protein